MRKMQLAPAIPSGYLHMIQQLAIIPEIQNLNDLLYRVARFPSDPDAGDLYLIRYEIARVLMTEHMRRAKLALERGVSIVAIGSKCEVPGPNGECAGCRCVTLIPVEEIDFTLKKLRQGIPENAIREHLLKTYLDREYPDYAEPEPYVPSGDPATFYDFSRSEE